MSGQDNARAAWRAIVERAGSLCLDSRKCSVGAIPESAEAIIALALRDTGRTVVLVTDGPRTLAERHRDCLSLSGLCGKKKQVLFFPPRELASDPSRDRKDLDATGDRLNVLLRLADKSADMPVIVTCVQAVMQSTDTPEHLSSRTAVIKAGDECDPAGLAERLVSAGYEFVPEVSTKGQASLRGGLLDAWPSTGEWPLRMEFSGSRVESIRSFDPATQRSVERTTIAILTSSAESNNAKGPVGTLLEHLPGNTVVQWCDPAGIEHHAVAFEESVTEADRWDAAVTYSTVKTRLQKSGASELSIGDTGDGPGGEAETLGFTRVESTPSLTREMLEPDIMDGRRRECIQRMILRAKAGQEVHVFFDTHGALDRFKEAYPAEASDSTLRLSVGAVSEGFINDELGLSVVSESDLYGRRKSLTGRYDPRTGASKMAGPGEKRIEGPADLEPGDLVVHVQHGIGRYTGLNTIVFDGQMQDVLSVEYAEGAVLHVPAAHSHMLTRYVGASKRSVALHKLGGKRWQCEKQAAGEAVRDFAAALLETQAMRDSLEGHAFPPDNAWQREFETSFPYRETKDQEEAILRTKKDMEDKRPMDRLVCGDVGFGKTEVAMRAAFKAVMGGKQVAVLVPTTVLCQQHFHTFSERMAAFPVRVEMLSRFVPQSKRTSTLIDLAKGAVDIVIGTHGLLQEGVTFADLGLVIIDEEQRFGVGHKERLKHIRKLVDVLTLTATPIPRTLYMSMIGVKDLSTVQTPPEHRLPIETVVSPNTDKVIHEAIMRELAREGQVFYLHNRVMTIERVYGRLTKLVPSARIAVAHGQMSSSDLSSVMDDFVRGAYDVLLCTTIIESGMDIPNVNTIIIDRADRFGLAELYQLRGRVGRSTRKAYAYLLLPDHTRLDPVARKRISILRRYKELGSGFNLALRDLEVRGAGSLLGTQQSGHVTAIGFLLYCQLLKRTISHLKGEKSGPVVETAVRLDFISLSPDGSAAESAAMIPREYIATDRLRINAYRSIAEASSLTDIEQVRTDLRDRYGPLPPPVERLLKMAAIRVMASERTIYLVESRDSTLALVRVNGSHVFPASRAPVLKGPAPDDKLDEITSILASLPK